MMAALMVVALAAPASAQLNTNMLGGGSKVKTDEDVKRETDSENAFKSGVAKIPDQKKGKQDPWGDVRGAAPPQSAPAQQRSGVK
jgi:hypothetical protein